MLPMPAFRRAVAVEGRSAPLVGNGYVATVPGGAYVYAQGLYNGGGSSSRTAAIPSAVALSPLDALGDFGKPIMC
jgi:hypothetical protein